ncbi:MAG: hypothetical protein FJX75_22785 [Armatimonadetes bacterium]|nr:hypothetical protein [Armatimonadota bacterium]
MIVILAGMMFGSCCTAQDEVVGKRPYELDWANRTQDDHPPLVGFEDLTGWTVETKDAEATFVRTREQQIWDKYVGKLTYKGTGNQPVVTLRPPQPVPIDKPFDAVTIWVYGNNWAWVSDPSTPQVLVSALFIDSQGQELSLPIWTVYWREWFLCHRRLSPDLIERVEGGAKLAGITVTGGRNKDDRVLYFDNLAVFTEQFPPLTLSERPQRGIDMFPGQTVGTNTGPGKLPFPTRKETILPGILGGAASYKSLVRAEGDAFWFMHIGREEWTFILTPRTGGLGDLDVCTGYPEAPKRRLGPCVDGGVYFATDEGPKPPERAEHLGTELQEDPEFAGGEHRFEEARKVVSRWRMSLGDRSVEVTYTYRMWGKSLVIDVVAPGGEIAEVRYGHCEGAQNPRLVTLPFYPMGAGGPRPAVMVSDTGKGPLFLMGNTCWYLSNASLPFAVNEVKDGKATYNGGVRYIPKTDGKRNDVYERFFVTLSNRFEEVLPTIPNPESQWKQITGTHQWIAHGAGNRENDLKFFRETHRYGMTEVVITDHETMWRDGGESFTFRTRTAPGKGGDPSQVAYGKALQEELGFVYGPYNNFTDYSPVNEYWSVDRVTRTPDNQLMGAWARCYAPKATVAVEFCEKLSPINQEKFHFSTAYCDVHTAVAPWDRTDYDYRVPGAGTFTGVFYPYGEIMLLQKKAWNGPVYSEGNNHAFFCGLTDGNYGQDQRYGVDVNPWLVDFDLRKMHDLCCNFGIGSPDMFYSGGKSLGSNEQEIDASIDRFFCATVAFGHPGFLTYAGGGLRTALRGYYMLQQLHSQYCLSSADEIRYADAKGKLLDTSAAVASGDFRRSQIVTRYKNGCVTVCNGSMTERLKVEAHGRKLDLPPNGYAGWMPDGSIDVLSSDDKGTRTDYAVTPAYLFIDGRGTFVRHPRAAGNGIGVCRKLEAGKWEIIPFRGAECGFGVVYGTAVALDVDRKEIGPAEVRSARGLTYVMPVEGAFSYVLTEAPKTQVELACDRTAIVPGETVTIRGHEKHEYTCPSDAKPGQRLWQQFENAWIDFTVVPLADLRVSLEGNDLCVTIRSNLPGRVDGELGLGQDKFPVAGLRLGEAGTLCALLPPPHHEAVEFIPIELRVGDLRRATECCLRTTRGYQRLAEMPTKYTWGIRARGAEETNDPGETRAHVVAGTPTSGGVAKAGLQAHPPWVGGVGYTFALYDPVTIPNAPAAAFRCQVGKGDGSDPGDGILYKVEVVDADGKATDVGQQLVTEHEWLPLEADLTPWAGQTVQIKVIADVGINDNSSGDWACWAEPKIESLDELLVRTLASDPERYRREAGPYPVAGLTVADLRAAKAGWVHYEGCGLSGTGEYGTIAILNRIEMGDMTPAGGDETKSIYTEASVPLTPEAIKSLGRRNVFSIGDPRQDWFKVRRFWLELQLADGRKCSSDISTATFTQPPSWPYAEGIGVPHGTDIAVDVWFNVPE